MCLYVCDLLFVLLLGCVLVSMLCFFFFQAEDGIRDLVRSRGLGDVYKRQRYGSCRGNVAPRRPAAYGGRAA